MNRTKLYLAGPLFSQVERRFNCELTSLLERFFDVFLPQRDGGLLTDMVTTGISAENAAQSIFRTDIQAIKQCDVLLIVLDGRAVDEGAAVELGYAYALGKSCYGLQTDSRRLMGTCNNPMIDGCIEALFHTVHELLSWAAKFTGAELSVQKRDPESPHSLAPKL